MCYAYTIVAHVNMCVVVVQEAAKTFVAAKASSAFEELLHLVQAAEVPLTASLRHAQVRHSLRVMGDMFCNSAAFSGPQICWAVLCL